MCRSTKRRSLGANTRRCQKDGQASHVMTGRLGCQQSMWPWKPRDSQRWRHSQSVSSVWHSRQQVPKFGLYGPWQQAWFKLWGLTTQHCIIPAVALDKDVFRLQV